MHPVFWADLRGNRYLRQSLPLIDTAIVCTYDTDGNGAIEWISRYVPRLEQKLFLDTCSGSYGEATWRYIGSFVGLPNVPYLRGMPRSNTLSDVYMCTSTIVLACPLDRGYCHCRAIAVSTPPMYVVKFFLSCVSPSLSLRNATVYF